MALSFQVETIDGLDEAIASLYTETDDGKYQLTVDGMPKPSSNGDEFSELKKGIERERQNARKAQREAAQWKSLGVDPDEIQELLTAKEKAAEKRLKDEGEFEKVLGQHRNNWETEKTTLVSERDGAIKALKSHVGESAFVTELAKAGATEEGVSLLPLSFTRRIRVEIADGNPMVEVLMSDGETPMAGTSKDGRATLHDLVEEAQKTFPSLFKGKGLPGGGKPPSSGDGGKPNRKFEEMSGADLKALRASNPEEYSRLHTEYKQRIS